MFFILSKLLSFVLTPLMWILFFMLWVLFTKKTQRKKRLMWLMLLLFLFFSNRWIADSAMGKLELPFSSSNFEKKYDIAIVLGGLSSYNFETKHIEWREASDRLLFPLEMYRQGRVGKFLISGGSGSFAHPENREAVYLRQFLLNLGIPKSDILMEKKSRNTHENAVFSKELLDSLSLASKSLLLVTSASHMRRARACFRKVGLNFDVLPVDFVSEPSIYYFDQYFVPDAEAFEIWRMLLKEMIGCAVYRIKGFL